MFDLVIKNGLILDGSGKDGYVADVALKDGKIAAIGQGLSGEKMLDATGLAVSAGWIDSHSHSDSAILTYPDQKEKVEQGITFSITGQCGGSATPRKKVTAAEWFAEATATPQGSGSAVLIGHNTLRKVVMGPENRDPTPEELEKMKQLLAEGIDAGAIGMSLGLYYVPGCYSKTEEAIALAKVVAEKGGLLAAHIRNESDKLIEAVEEYLRIARESGCRAVISHHKACFRENWGNVKKTLQMVDQANAAGGDIYMDVYPYIASNTTMLARFVPSIFHPPGTTQVVKLLDDPQFCQRLKEWEINCWGTKIDWALITQYPPKPELEGMTVSQAAAHLGMTDEYEAAFRLLRESEGAGSACFFSMCEEDLACVLAHPRAMICTDASVAGALNRFHPRLRASFPRALGRYAREQQVVSVPEMIRKMTALPAHVYGLAGKGRVAEGYDADLCIFDPATIRDQADFIKCDLPNVGLRYVLIDGKIVVEDGVYNGTRAAKVIRR